MTVLVGNHDFLTGCKLNGDSVLNAEFCLEYVEISTNGVKYTDGKKREEVVKMAESSDVAIVCVGNHPTGNAGWAECSTQSDGKEAVDRKSILLEQEQLVKEVYQANRNTILVPAISHPYPRKLEFPAVITLQP